MFDDLLANMPVWFAFILAFLFASNVTYKFFAMPKVKFELMDLWAFLFISEIFLSASHPFLIRLLLTYSTFVYCAYFLIMGVGFPIYKIIFKKIDTSI